MLYVPRESFISTQFFVLNLVDWFWCNIRHLLFFDIPLLYYYINLRSSLTLCILSGDIYIYIFLRYYFLICNCFWIILLQSFWDFPNFICDFIANEFTSCFCWFLNSSFWRSFKCICSRLFSMIKRFLVVFTT